MDNMGDKKLGFGCMRLPMRADQPEEVDIPQFCQMMDRFLAEGFRYVDTAHGYVGGKSETAIREALVRRYPRDAYCLTDKLTSVYIKQEADVRPLFETQLAAAGVEYFDYYLIHAVTTESYPVFQRCKAFEQVCALRDEGKIRHIGISFHDQPEVLEQVLGEHPEIEVVQIQFNYVDYNAVSIRSKAVYDVCCKHHKPVIVMEPVKGGNLAALSGEAAKPLDALNGGSYASYAVRFAAGFDNVCMVLSGMSTLAQTEDNLSYMKDFRPLSEQEHKAVAQVRDALGKQGTIPCTDCRYCVEGCPKHILIPNLFSCMNNIITYPTDWNSRFYYGVHTAKGHGKASDCIKCRRCEKTCPQHLPITELLRQVSQTFEQKA